MTGYPGCAPLRIGSKGARLAHQLDAAGGAMSPDDQDLITAARKVRENAHAPYSGFKVGAALRAASGRIYLGCNVENVAYPEGTCAEAGAIAAMVAAGDTTLVAIAVIADSPAPVPPCGGCRQKLAEFGAGHAPVTMVTTAGQSQILTIAELLPGSFSLAHMGRG
jgi:cytidine deaminase